MPTHYQGTDEERLALDVFIKLMRAADTVAMTCNRTIRSAGLTPTQFGVLETLYHLGPLHICILAEKHLKSRNNLTTVVDNLERGGLVTRCTDPKDRRAIVVSLTEPGRELIREAIPQHAEEVRFFISKLTVDEQALLNDLLRKLGLPATTD